MVRDLKVILAEFLPKDIAPLTLNLHVCRVGFQKAEIALAEAACAI